ncbi:MAG: IPTL-CTERM sorting domain-containing protein [Chitinophagales bacterium]
MRIAAITAPPSAVIGGPVYQTFNTAGGFETVTVTLNTPFPVTGGNDYAFDITAGTNFNFIYAAALDDEPSGIFYEVFFGSFTSYTSQDLDFEVAISAAAEPAAASIPTLSQWGLIILALLLMTLGTLYLVQPNVEERIGR